MSKTRPPGGKPPRAGTDRTRRRPARTEKPETDRRQRRGARESATARERKPRQAGRSKPERPERSERATGGAERTSHTWRRRRSERPSPGGDVMAALAASQVGPGGYLRFGDIPAHRLGRSLRGELYRLANSLPDDERQNLAARIKHAATTVTAALATGFGEGSFRAGVSRSLESRGALYALQDHLQQLRQLELLDDGQLSELSGRIDEVVAAVNDYLGVLVRERRRIDTGT